MQGADAVFTIACAAPGRVAATQLRHPGSPAASATSRSRRAVRELYWQSVEKLAIVNAVSCCGFCATNMPPLSHKASTMCILQDRVPPARRDRRTQSKTPSRPRGAWLGRTGCVSDRDGCDVWGIGAKRKTAGRGHGRQDFRQIEAAEPPRHRGPLARAAPLLLLRDGSDGGADPSALRRRRLVLERGRALQHRPHAPGPVRQEGRQRRRAARRASSAPSPSPTASPWATRA